MKKLLVAVSAPAIALAFTLGSVPVSAAPTVQAESIAIDGSIITPMDTTIHTTVGSEIIMTGSDFNILYGSNVVSLSGSKATMIGEGTAQVAAYKSNGQLNGVYTFVVTR
ncbi:hypothetical protein AMQ84_31445 [Paenibacillus riograndensis]|uniref:IPT/TIG domain-containing protein n=1 Tax=Paenibacillus riograndensis TaxID=483937 RepID=A0A132TDU1_9BACL|nr:hypothetical protein [Paenibacillus riograndensis]KWX69495.1 hypothetical protein AMQ84_31445 [Paenibacillus riograndensis]